MKTFMNSEIASYDNFSRWTLLYAVGAIYNYILGGKNVDVVESETDPSRVPRKVNAVANPLITGAGVQAGMALVSSAQSQSGRYFDAIPQGLVSQAVVLGSGRAGTNTAQSSCSAILSALPPPEGAGERHFSGFASAFEEAAYRAFEGAKESASNTLRAAKSAFGWAASGFSNTPIAIGSLALFASAYLVYNFWKKSGVNVINSANNTNTLTNNVHLHIEAKHGMRVIQKNMENGDIHFSVEGPSEEKSMLEFKKMIKKTRAEREQSETRSGSSPFKTF